MTEHGDPNSAMSQGRQHPAPAAPTGSPAAPGRPRGVVLHGRETATPAPEPGQDDPVASTGEAAAPAVAELRAINEQLLITGLREQELADQLRLQLAFINAITSAIDDGVAALDRQGRVTFVNPAAARLMGEMAANLVGRALDEVVREWRADGSRSPATEDPLLEPLRSGAAVRTDEAIITRRDGTVVAVAASAAPIVADGRVMGAAVALRDITALQRQMAGQRFLAEASHLLATSLDYRATLAQVARLAVPHLADWCLVDIIGEDGRAARLEVAHADPTRAALAQAVKRFPPRPEINASHPPAQALLTSVSVLIPEFTDELMRQAAQSDEHLAAMCGVDARSCIVVPLVARGRALGALTFLATPESGRRYTADDLRLAEDLAGRAALAVDNARLYAEAQAATQARDDFLATVSHDLQNPLTLIRGYAQLLQRQLRHPGTVDAAQLGTELAQIDTAVTRAMTLINDLLDLVRLHGGETLELARQPTDLVALARQMVAATTQTAHRAIEIEAEVAALIGQWDAARLERVLVNLLSNAVKYSPPASAIEVRVAREDDTAVLAVQDRGLGIPATDLPHIFERFHRAGNVTGRVRGTGLGLAGARAIVEQHGGSIAVESEEGLGSTFTVRLPLGEPTGE